ncbi:alpha/beta fold hydrolase [Leuconostoc lactis]|uniref:alpha/beta fold hydrolase n=1 Tax=Leuconostoc lactis TaxID=1246 RepID=UPI000E9B784A|nr:alpha/beta hydrolase [Leuconostoc lactis]HBP98130.1 alpha/beta hydrolase [Leuconostoc lactis]
MAHITTNDNVQLAYHVHGIGQPIILIAGYSGNQATWTAQIPAFVAAGYQVITYDRRNHGQSDQVAYGMRLSRHGMDLATIISALALKQPILLGHSMGASTIWAYLSLFGDADIRAVITEDQIPKMIQTADWPYGLLGSDWQHLPAALTQLPTTKLTNLKLSADIKRAIGQHFQPFDFKLNAPLLENSAVQDWRDVLRREAVPHLFITGGQSPLWPAEHAKVLAQMTAHGQYVILPEAGHIPHIEDPATFNDAILTFLNRL